MCGQDNTKMVNAIMKYLVSGSTIVVPIIVTHIFAQKI